MFTKRNLPSKKSSKGIGSPVGIGGGAGFDVGFEGESGPGAAHAVSLQSPAVLAMVVEKRARSRVVVAIAEPLSHRRKLAGKHASVDVGIVTEGFVRNAAMELQARDRD